VVSIGLSEGKQACSTRCSTGAWATSTGLIVPLLLCFGGPQLDGLGWSPVRLGRYVDEVVEWKSLQLTAASR